MQHLAELARDGIRIHIWPTQTGQFQANVSERGGNGWTCVTDADPMFALQTALRQRATGHPYRAVVETAEPTQLDLEDAIAAAPEPFDGCMICDNGGCDACRDEFADLGL